MTPSLRFAYKKEGRRREGGREKGRENGRGKRVCVL
jgi:hypothetical protein